MRGPLRTWAALVTALACLLSPWRTGAQVTSYTFQDIATLLESGLPPARLIARMGASCYAGELTPAVESRLRTVGADARLIQALRANPCPAAPVLPPPVANRVAPPAPLVPLQLRPASLALTVGEEAVLIPLIGGAPCLGCDIPTGARGGDVAFTWISTDTAVARVTNGTIRAVGAGEAVIVVSGTGFEAATTSVRVTPRPNAVTAVRIVPAEVTLVPGAQQRLGWVAYSGVNVVEPVDGSKPVWMVDRAADERIVLLQDGLLTGLKEGDVAVRVRLGEVVSEPARVSIRRKPMVTGLRAVVDTVRSGPGEPVVVSVRATGTALRAFSVDSLTWRLSDAGRLQLGGRQVVNTTDSAFEARVTVVATAAGVYRLAAAAGVAESPPVVLVVSGVTEARRIVPPAEATPEPSVLPEALVKAVADSLVDLLAIRNFYRLEAFLEATEPSRLRELLRIVQNVPASATPGVELILPAAAGRESIVVIRMAWRGNFGGETRTLRFSVTTGDAGELLVRFINR